MNSNEEILSAIRDLRRDVNSRIRQFEKRFGVQDTALKVLGQEQARQQRKIDELTEAVNDLIENGSVIWKSKDGKKIGLDQEDTYEKFREYGYSGHEALRLLDEAKMLVRERGTARTKGVRVNGQPVRAIVIFTEGGKKDE